MATAPNGFPAQSERAGGQAIAQIVGNEDDRLAQHLPRVEQDLPHVVAEQRAAPAFRLVHRQDVGRGGRAAGGIQALLIPPDRSDR